MKHFTCDTIDCNNTGVGTASSYSLPTDWRSIQIILGASSGLNRVTANKDLCPQCSEKLTNQMKGLRQDPDATQTPEDVLYDVVRTMVDESVDERMSQ